MSSTGEEGVAPATGTEDRALALVHEGWNHLQLQRPFAAWASWQRALRVVVGFPAAVEALSRLDTASDLPAAARTVQRFQPPGDAERRSRWDSRIRGQDLEDLREAGDLFGRLVSDDPADAAAWFNRALCMAWLGHNSEAISCLDRATSLQSGRDLERAAAAWSLGEVLRQGAGAELLADDLRFLWVVDWAEADTTRLLHSGVTIREAPAPRDPVTGVPTFPEAAVYEWLDRPMPEPSPALRAADLPRLLATAVIARGTLRLSSPDPQSLERVREDLAKATGDPDRPILREAAPLPLTLLDAAAWTLRRPQGLDAETDGRLSREGIEHFYEDIWIHRPRQGLGGLTPLEAGRAAVAGDDLARARLVAVVAIREQLGARPRTAVLYQGYPFDRLRRRLGLEPRDPGSFDADDPTCMSEDELRGLDPGVLSREILAEAFRSTTAVGDDANTVRFASRLIDELEAGGGFVRADPDLFAPLVREAMRSGDSQQALDWLARARAACPAQDRRIYVIWSAEIHARTGDPDAALAAYRSLIDGEGLDTTLLLDAARDLIEYGYVEHAAPLLELAAEQAERDSDAWSLNQARSLAGVPDAEDAPG